MSVLSTLSSLTRPVAGIATVPLKVAGRVASTVHGLMPTGTSQPEAPATAAKAQGDPVTPLKKPAPKKAPAAKAPVTKAPVTKAPAAKAAAPTPVPEPAPVTDIDAAAESLAVDVTPADVVGNLGTDLESSRDDV